MKKWDQEQEKKPAHLRKPCPAPPENLGKTIEKAKEGNFDENYNQAAFDNFNEKALEPCPKCGRTFLPESLQRHLKGCHAKGEAPQETKQSPSPSTSRPKALICYICGREYGSASLEIHLKACRKKWDQEQDKKPAHLRKPCPAPPETLGATIEKAKVGNFDE